MHEIGELYGMVCEFKKKKKVKDIRETKKGPPTGHERVERREMSGKDGGSSHFGSSGD